MGHGAWENRLRVTAADPQAQKIIVALSPQNVEQ
jgi:hypothetical protein